MSQSPKIGYVLKRFPRLSDADPLIAAARKNGVHVYSGRPYFQHAPRHATLLLGYTTVSIDEIETGVERLAAAYRKTLRL